MPLLRSEWIQKSKATERKSEMSEKRGGGGRSDGRDGSDAGRRFRRGFVAGIIAVAVAILLWAASETSGIAQDGKGKNVSVTTPSGGTTGKVILSTEAKTADTKTAAAKTAVTAGGAAAMDDDEEMDPVARAAWFDARRKKAAEEAAHAIQVRKYGADGRGDGYDPIVEHGEYFTGWSKPDLTLVFTGQVNSYLEPCGCAGLVRMNGGLSRRFSFIHSLRENGWNPIGFDVGGQIHGVGRQEELKFQLAIEALRRMGYGAITLGAGDLRLAAQELVSYVASTDAKMPSLFVSANVAPFGFDSGYTAFYRKLRAGGITVGVTGALGDSFLPSVADDNLTTRSATQGLAEVLPKLKGCDLVIVLSHATPEESEAIARQFPVINVIVTAGGPAEPPREMPDRVERADGSYATLVEVGERGNAAIVLGFDRANLSQPRYQRVLLDSRYPASPEITALLRDYQATLKEAGFEKLERRPIPYPNAKFLGEFVGSASCRECHPEVYEHWLTTKHAAAMKTLAEVSVPPRDFDPDCICCHVVGWDPQKSFPWIGGYAGVKTTPELAGVGCESCHGPGGAHNVAERDVKNGMTTDTTLQKQLREVLHQTPGEAEKKVCIRCHDGDNSPDFDFRLYHPVIDHPVLP